MLKNYVTTAFRNLLREKSTAFINLLGLTLGIAASLVLFLLIRYQASFDDYHTKGDRTYRIVTQAEGNGTQNYTEGVPTVFTEALRTDFPELEEVTFISYRSGCMITIPQKQGEAKKYEEERGVTYAQSNYFKIFDRKIVAGNAEKGLDNPNEAIISLRSAEKYFGRTDVLGEIVRFENIDYKVTAVMEDHPANTDLPFDLMFSYVTVKKERDENGWGSIWSDEQCYLLLPANLRGEDVAARFPAFHAKYHKDNPSKQAYFLQPMRELHFDERYSNFSYNTVSRQTLIALGVIGIFLIVTACINFINLTTAEAIKRSREVGVRKLLGSSRRQLITQFLGETGLVTFFAVLLAVGITQIALGFLNPFLELKLALNFLGDGMLWTYLIVVLIGVALFSGFYPALIVSGFRVSEALKNKISNRNSSGYNLRRTLVVLQFFISQFFIIGTIVLINQMDFFRNTSLGFRRDAIVTVPIPEKKEKDAGSVRTFRQELAGINGVEKVSLSNTPPSSSSTSNTYFNVAGSDEKFRTQVKQVDGNYVDLYQLNILAGRNLLDLDTAQGVLVNEKLAAVVGEKKAEDMIGKRLRFWGLDLPVVGIVKDFHTVSLRDAIEPTVMFNNARGYDVASIQINPTRMQDVQLAIKTKWEATYPNHIYSSQFLDDEIRRFYDSERKMSILLTVFTSMAITIGCLGLFGLVTFMANQKTKEIGVRKVLGASLESILLLFSKEYIKLILIGFVLSAPAAWYVMNLWLDEFAYKITIGPMVFLSGIGITLGIALLTVGYRSLKAAVVNPAQSLKSE